MIIRAATTDDIDAITSLYNDLGVATTASYDLRPATVAERRDWLDDHTAHDWPVLVSDDAGTVIGYAAYGAFRHKAGYDHTVEHSVYVASGRQSDHIGTALMSSLIDIARGHHLHAMVGAVDAGNAASVRFHESLGFTVAGTLPQVGRKFGRWLDVTFLVLLLDASPAGAGAQITMGDDNA